MKAFFYLFFTVLMVFFFQGCATTYNEITVDRYYNQFRAHHPKSILILPARNFTTASDASELYGSSITEVLSDKGYYVFPVQLVDRFLKSENLFEPEIVRKISVNKIKEVFNADSVLYVNIYNWKTDYRVFSGSVSVRINMILVDTTSGEEIWSSNAYAQENAGGATGGIIELIASAIDTAINANINYTEMAFKANSAALNNLPSGIYSNNFNKDSNQMMFFSDHKSSIYHKMYIQDNKIFIPKLLPLALPKEGELVVFRENGGKKFDGYVYNNPAYYNYRNLEEFYYYFEINNKKYLRHQFFNYEKNKPFIVLDSKKVFLKTDEQNKIIYEIKKSIIDDYLVFPIDSLVD